MMKQKTILNSEIVNSIAKDYKAQAQEAGLIEDRNETLSILALNKYIDLGIDYILIGMRDTEYVEQIMK